MAVAAGPAANAKQVVSGESRTWDGTKWVLSPLPVSRVTTAKTIPEANDNDIVVNPDTGFITYLHNNSWWSVFPFVPWGGTDNAWPLPGSPPDGAIGFGWSGEQNKGMQEINMRRGNGWVTQAPRLDAHGYVGAGYARSNQDYTGDVYGIGNICSFTGKFKRGRVYLAEFGLNLVYDGNASQMVTLNAVVGGRNSGSAIQYLSKQYNVSSIQGCAKFANPHGNHECHLSVPPTSHAFQWGSAYLIIRDVGT